jgi:hypothetical protein
MAWPKEVSRRRGRRVRRRRQVMVVAIGKVCVPVSPGCEI